MVPGGKIPHVVVRVDHHRMVERADDAGKRTADAGMAASVDWVPGADADVLSR